MEAKTDTCAAVLADAPASSGGERLGARGFKLTPLMSSMPHYPRSMAAAKPIPAIGPQATGQCTRLDEH